MNATPETSAEALRTQILALVREYYRIGHQPGQQAPFVPGETFLNYAGRIYDEEELVALVDSSLDFRLTADRYAKEFEQRLAKEIGVRHALAVNSGSSANLVAFNAITSSLLGDRRVRKGDEVITVAAGFPTTVAPAVQFGAVPVFLDVDLHGGTYNIDVSMLEEARSERTRAVMIAHTLGNPFNLDAVKAFCDKYKLWLIEDNCDALGATYRGKLTGSFGDLATSSFYPAHHITTGEGGAVYTSKPLLKRAAESFRDWGRDCWCEAGKDNTCGKRFGWSLGELPFGYDHKYIYRHLGFNLKLTDMQAAIGCRQLDKLPAFVEARRRNWNLLRQGLAELEDYFILPNPTEHSVPSWFGFLLTVREDAGFSRNEVTDYLEERKIQTRVLFAGNMLKHPMFDELRTEPGAIRVVGDLRNSDYIMSHSFWFGVYPGLSEAKVGFIIESLLDFVRGRTRLQRVVG